MKKLVAVLLAIIMMMSVSIAEVASPILPTIKPVEIRNDKGDVIETNMVVTVVPKEEAKKSTTTAVEVVEKKASEITKIFSGIMPSNPSMPSIPSVPSATAVPSAPADETVAVPGEAPVLTVEEVKIQVEEAYVQAFGQEAVEELKEIVEVIPEVSVGNLTIDEIAPLYIGGYEENMGDVHVVVESVTQYKDTDVLVAMIGIMQEMVEIAEAVSEEEMLKWIPLNAAVEEGKVVVAFTEDAMKLADGKESIIVLMRAEELEMAI